VGAAKNGDKQSRQSNSKYRGPNFLQYAFFGKIYVVYIGVWGKATETGEFSGVFVLKVTLQSELMF